LVSMYNRTAVWRIGCVGIPTTLRESPQVTTVSAHRCQIHRVSSSLANNAIRIIRIIGRLLCSETSSIEKNS
jgi:hypothetical protein